MQSIVILRKTVVILSKRFCRSERIGASRAKCRVVDDTFIARLARLLICTLVAGVTSPRSPPKRLKIFSPPAASIKRFKPSNSKSTALPPRKPTTCSAALISNSMLGTPAFPPAKKPSRSRPTTVSIISGWDASTARRRIAPAFLKAAGLAKKVRTEFERAVEFAPNNWEARTDLAEFYLEAPGIVGGGKDKARAQADLLAAAESSHGALGEGAHRQEKQRQRRSGAGISRRHRRQSRRRSCLGQSCRILSPHQPPRRDGAGSAHHGVQSARSSRGA